MKKLLFILPTLLLLTACGGNKVVTEDAATIPTKTTVKSSEKEALLNNVEINNNYNEEGISDDSSKKTSNIKIETNTPKTLDCNETCGRAEKDTDGVVSEKECLMICNTGVENCQNKLNKDEITGDLLELCAVGELVKEVKVRYPDLESLF